MLAAAGLLAPAAAGAHDPVASLLAALDPPDGMAEAGVRAACGADPLCAARLLAEHAARPARLQRVEHPDSDRIRWATTPASVAGIRRLPGGGLVVVLDRFGRTAVRELAAAAEGHEGALVLDLRHNGGGSVRRMLTVAALFTGPRADALLLDGPDGTQAVAIPEPGRPLLAKKAPLTLLIGPATASSAEILAGLLRRYAGARLLGERSAGKDWLYRVIPVDHDWRLLWPGATARIPGVALAGGLVPDGPVDPTLAAALGPSP